MTHVASSRAIDNGANVSLVEYIQDDYGGWELVAKTDVPENETLFEIPVGIAMHGDNVTDHPIIGKIFAQAKKYVCTHATHLILFGALSFLSVSVNYRVIPNFDSPSAGALGGIVMLLHYVRYDNIRVRWVIQGRCHIVCFPIFRRCSTIITTRSGSHSWRLFLGPSQCHSTFKGRMLKYFMLWTKQETIRKQLMAMVSIVFAFGGNFSFSMPK